MPGGNLGIVVRRARGLVVFPPVREIEGQRDGIMVLPPAQFSDNQSVLDVGDEALHRRHQSLCNVFPTRFPNFSPRTLLLVVDVCDWVRLGCASVVPTLDLRTLFVP